MVKQSIVVCAVAMLATALVTSAHGQSGLAGLSPAAQAEIQRLSPAQRAALAHSLLGDNDAAPAPASVPPATRGAPGSVAQGSTVATVAVAPAPAAPAAPGYDWTGCYVAAGAGVGMFNDEHHLQATSVGVVTANTTTGGNGLLGRFGAGCDYQIATRFVLGAFGDVDLSNMAGTMGESGIVGKETEHWAWTVGARAGYLLWPQVLAYIDGGFTEARFHFNGLNIDLLGPPVPSGLSLGSYVANGVFGGAGFEMPIDFLPGAFWRNEYRFAYYSPMNDPFQGPLIPGDVERVQPTVQTVTTSLVYKLDWNRFLH